MKSPSGGLATDGVLEADDHNQVARISESFLPDSRIDSERIPLDIHIDPFPDLRSCDSIGNKFEILTRTDAEGRERTEAHMGLVCKNKKD